MSNLDLSVICGAKRRRTSELENHFYGSLCGFLQRITFITRSVGESRFYVAGGQLCGAHVIAGTELSSPNAYHIGGGGITLDEALIRCLAESAERYSQVVSGLTFKNRITFCPRAGLADDGRKIFDLSTHKVFDVDQYSRVDFPFRPYSPDLPIGWLTAREAVSSRLCWLPAQSMFTGYLCRENKGEPWLYPAVSTGTACHESVLKATRSALLELIQIDAAMGHWYGLGKCDRIVFDGSLSCVNSIIENFGPRDSEEVEFYSLDSPGFDCFNIACVIKNSLSIPRVSVGLGCDLDLERAIYKALIETICVVQLAKIGMAFTPRDLIPRLREQDTQEFKDFDTNVLKYAIDPQVVDRRFASAGKVNAKELSESRRGEKRSLRDEVRHLIDIFSQNQMTIYLLDITPDDVRSSGLVVMRAWSPDTLPLCIPSYLPLAHHRFETYGGVAHKEPHPYP